MKAAVFQVLLSLLFVSVCSCRTNTSSPGDRQSPINIDTTRVKQCERRYGPISELQIMYDYPPNSTVIVSKDNNTVKWVPEKISKDFIVNFFGDVWVFAELHFHWSASDNEGSEHTINDIRRSMEAHLVFFKAIYRTKEEAMKQSDGYLVIGVFLQAGNPNNPKFESLSKITTQAEVSDEPFTVTAREAYEGLIESFPRNSKYYTYFGSLTTPPFSENVRWIVFAFVIPISSDQIKPFRQLTYEGRELTPNFRQIQPRKSRIICHSESYKVYNQQQ